MAKHNIGEKNGMWKGGKTIASNGYVLNRVGTDNHSADIRGYAYEHRLVAEKTLGRRLENGEIVHHRNGVKKDNRPANLEIVKSIAEHREKHRIHIGRLKKVGEPNPIISCACGCGRRFRKYDKSNRPREYVSGHSPIIAPTMDSILKALCDGPLTRAEISQEIGLEIKPTASALSKLKSRAQIKQQSRGLWCLPEHFVITQKRRNPSIQCACGCGDKFRKYDEWGRPRRFISGHNARK